MCIPNDSQPPPRDDIAPPTPQASTPLGSSGRSSEDSLHRSHLTDLSQYSGSRKSSATAELLRERLHSARRECPPNSHFFFVPNCVQESLITVDTVAREIQAGKRHFGQPEAEQLAEETCHSARHLFAILAYMKRAPEICTLLEEGVSDEDLPLMRRHEDQQRFALKLRTGNPIKTMEYWSDEDLENFDRFQWWMTAPVFVDKRHYDLYDNTILPFIPFRSDIETKEPKQGGYSEVYPVRVHPSHHQFWKRTASEVCQHHSRFDSSSDLIRDRTTSP